MARGRASVPVADLTRDALTVWGRAWGAALQAPAFVTLQGELGAGKTTLVQAICAGLGVTDDVTSPTYALVHEYAGAKGTVHHLDLYRLRDAGQLAQLGWEEMLGSRGVVLVEWPERAADLLPRQRRELHLAHIAERPDLRRLTWTA
jgi:tRNA threonylcarbamoyladenosine biosynthesis protein TsaE